MIAISPEQNDELVRQSEMLASLSSAAEIMSGKKHTEDPPEASIHAKPEPPPNYYYIGRHVEALGDLIGPLPFFVASAIKYIWRAGMKPGNTAVEDLWKASNCCLLEIQRLEKL